MITLAAYKGRGKTLGAKLQDFCIRFRTAHSWVPYNPAIYSHVEVIIGKAFLGQTCRCYSASGREGLVRAKDIKLSPESWDLIHLDIEPGPVIEFIEGRIGERYDYLGILFSQALRLGLHSRRSWFCSELIAAALGLPLPHQFHPQMLFEICKWLSETSK